MKITSWKELKNIVRSIPIEDAARIREGDLELKKKGNQIFGFCPFHSDERQGNFAFGGPHNGFKCFACGESGDIINLIMKIDGCNFKEAITKVAVEMEMMTQKDADDFLENGKSASVKEQEVMRKFSSELDITLSEEEIEVRDAVYSLLSEGEAVINPVADYFEIEGNHKRLSEEHYNQLIKERGLSEEQIEETGFFTMKEGSTYLPAIYLRLFEERGLTPNTLNVPGFWRFNDGLKVGHLKRLDGSLYDFEEQGHGPQSFWYYEPINALGIPIRNVDGKIIGIQLRPDDKEFGGKYIWLSSATADGTNGKADGLSAGAQKDVLFPKEITKAHAFITEGKFKSLAIAETFNTPSISLQGVNTYNGLSKVIEGVKEKNKRGLKYVFVAFDADLSFNDAVLKATIDMAQKELSEYTVYIAVWDYLFGKGIDDLIQSGHKEAIVRLKIEQLQEIKELLDEEVPMNEENKKNKEQAKAKREVIFYKWLKELHPNMMFHEKRKV